MSSHPVHSPVYALFAHVRSGRPRQSSSPAALSDVVTTARAKHFGRTTRVGHSTGPAPSGTAPRARGAQYLGESIVYTIGWNASTRFMSSGRQPVSSSTSTNPVPPHHQHLALVDDRDDPAIGVDLAAEPTKTAMARIRWDAGRAHVLEVQLGVADEQVVAAVADADEVGIDCPLGWPRAFVAFVNEHERGDVQIPVEVLGKAWRRTLAYRLTDEVVRTTTGLVPSSVSADEIAHPAMRAAVLLAMLTRTLGDPVRRDGSGRVVEVYPAASLAIWRLPHRGYKGSSTTNVHARARLLAELRQAAPWLDLGSSEQLCQVSDDALDAIIASRSVPAPARPGPSPHA